MREDKVISLLKARIEELRVYVCLYPEKTEARETLKMNIELLAKFCDEVGAHNPYRTGDLHAN